MDVRQAAAGDQRPPTAGDPRIKLELAGTELAALVVGALVQADAADPAPAVELAIEIDRRREEAVRRHGEAAGGDPLLEDVRLSRHRQDVVGDALGGVVVPLPVPDGVPGAVRGDTLDEP